MSLKITTALVLGMSSSFLCFGAASYIQEDLDRFKNTKSCIQCDLSKADLFYYEDGENSIATDSDFSGSNMVRVNLSNSHLEKTLFIKSNLLSGFLSSSIFDGANFVGANCENAIFSRASFKGAVLDQANFSGANLSNVDFENASLKNVNFSKAILIGAKITEQQLKQVKSLDGAIMPNGDLFEKH